MTDHLPDVQITDEQDDRATALERAVIERPASAASVIVHLQDALNTANANHERFEREWYLRGDEIERLTESLRQQESQLRTALDELRQRGPHVHGMLLDRMGWICSVCYGWNHPQYAQCTHTHAVTTGGTPR